MHILVVYDEEMRWGIQGYPLCLLDNLLKVATVAARVVNVRTPLLRKNFSRNFSSIRSGPLSSAKVVCCIQLLTSQTYFSIQANSVDPEHTAPR